MTITHIPELGNLPKLDGAACQTFPWPDLFYPEEGERTRNPDELRLIREICSGCPVQVECLRYALDNDEKFGFWGGFSPEERNRMKPEPTQPEREKNQHEYTASREVERDMKRMNISLEEACTIHGIKVASYITFKQRERQRKAQKK